MELFKPDHTVTLSQLVTPDLIEELQTAAAILQGIERDDLAESLRSRAEELARALTILNAQASARDRTPSELWIG